MKNTRLIIFLAAAVLLAACGYTSLRFQQTVNGSGILGREARTAAGIERVRMSGFGELIISQGEREALTVEADDNLLPNFITQTNNGTLSIHERIFFSFKPSLPVVFRLTVRNLKALDLSDFARVKVVGLDTPALSVSLSDFSQLSVENLQTTELNGKMNGFSSLTVSGQVARERVEKLENATYQIAGQ